MFTGTSGSPSVIGHHGVLAQEPAVGSYRVREPFLVGNDNTHPYRTVIVKPGQELGGIPVGVRRFPVAIRPDNLRLVPERKPLVGLTLLLLLLVLGSRRSANRPHNHVVHLRQQLMHHELLRLKSVLLVAQVQRVEPLVQGVVESIVQRSGNDKLEQSVSQKSCRTWHKGKSHTFHNCVLHVFDLGSCASFSANAGCDEKTHHHHYSGY